MAAPFAVRFHSAHPMVPTKNEMAKRPINIFFIIAISPLIENLKEGNIFNVKNKQKLCQFL
jgi:hypothetical protein